ncbi:hypothetical protein [Dietzia timorensis]|uniref:Uncharacterized protein n=1 Tax=Dietzia timorensis TaxID=499555 RepID=A0A173LKW6_9ACTN|nr:hypothetical protein [Dietzia timorensis]ANI91220.1 Hypothetical protein BJL86_0410 [Dietzia timorensis]
MSITLKRAIATTTLATTGIAGTLGVGALAAAPAGAKVDSGTYTIRSTNVGITSLPGKAVVSGNKLIMPGAPALVLHSTPRGAYADFGVTRYTFTKRNGQLYSGKIMVGPIQTGTITLRKR